MSDEIEKSLAEQGPGTSSTDYGALLSEAQPSPHRFELESPTAPEGTAKERLHALRDAISAVSEDYPEVIGATVYGSTVKGRVKPESDIDGFMFVDTDRAASEGRPVSTQNKANGIYFEPYTTSYYGAVVSEMEALGYREAMLKDFAALPISRQIVTASIDKLLPQAEVMENFWNQVRRLEPKAKEIQVQAIKDFRVFDVANDQRPMTAEERQQFDEGFISELPPEVNRDLLRCPDIRDARNIRGLFHLGINNQPLRQYRSKVISELQAQGELGVIIWEDIGQWVLMFEKDRQEAKAYWPSTLEEAAQVYGDEQSAPSEA